MNASAMVSKYPSSQAPVHFSFSSCTTGPMGSGKTAALIGLVKVLEQSEVNDFLIVTHTLDQRNPDGIKSRNGKTLHAVKCNGAEQIKQAIRTHEKTTLQQVRKIIIDECQFFGADLVDFVRHFLNASPIQFFCFGLEEDSEGKPFGAMPGLIKNIPHTHRLFADCYFDGCKEPACKTRRVFGNSEQILLGDTNYSASCKEHWKK